MLKEMAMGYSRNKMHTPKEDMGIPKILPTFFIGKGKGGMRIPKFFYRF